MKWENCVFDLYGTLVDIHTDETLLSLWQTMQEYYRKNGAVYETPEELRDRYFQVVREQEQGRHQLRSDAHEAHPEIQIENVFLQLFRERGIAAELPLAVQSGRLFREASLDYIKLYDGAKELLESLRNHACKVYLLSNAQGIFTRYELELLGLTDAFDGVYLSSDYGCKKPDPKFFRVLLEERAICPERTVMIGNDGVCDIAGARGVGMHTIYIHSNISPHEPMPEADYCLSEMDLLRVRQILLG